MTYDKIEWHSGSDDFPKELSFKNGGIHIGMFLAWIINNDLTGSLHAESSKESIKELKKKQITGTDFLVKECNSKFWDEDLSAEGNDFASVYYSNEDAYGKYIDDYAEVFDTYETLYHVEDNWKNYELIAPIITKRYNEWKANK